MRLTAPALRNIAQERGLRILPCQAGSKVPLTPHGFKASDAEIEQAFEKAGDDVNVALVAGPASGGVVGIDCEVPEVATALFPKLDELKKQTWIVKTPHGGLVVLLRALDVIPPRQIRVAGPDHPFDICGEGGYFLIHGWLDHEKCEPTKQRCPHKGRTWYETISETLDILAVERIEDSLRRRCEKLGWTTSLRRWPRVKDVATGVQEGNRNQAAFVMSRYLRFTLHLSESDAWFALCQWNDLNKPPLPKSELRTVFESAAKYPKPERPQKIVIGV